MIFVPIYYGTSSIARLDWLTVDWLEARFVEGMLHLVLTVLLEQDVLNALGFLSMVSQLVW